MHARAVWIFPNKMLPRNTTVVCRGDTRWYWYVTENVIIRIRELPLHVLKLLSYSWASFSIFETSIVFVSFVFSFFLYYRCKFCETKKCCYLLTIGALHRHNCWYQLCNNGDISLLGWTLPKIRIASKKVSNKNCSELNFTQRSLLAHKSISLRSGARGLERLASWKYYSAGKQ